MTAQAGKDLLLKMDSDGQGTFVTVAGLRARSVVFDAQTIDVTDTESVAGWRALLASASTRSARVTGAGLFRDQASDEAVRTSFFDRTSPDWQIIIPDFGAVQGAFQIARLEYSGRHDNAVQFDMTLESAGTLTFTPA